MPTNRLLHTALAGSAIVFASIGALAQDETVIITGQQLNDVGALKSDVPLLEIPQAISVVTAETIRDRGITRLAEALRTVAGVSRSSTYGFYDAYQIRGFDAAYSNSVYLDGLLSANVAGANNELAGLERVEVVKGPASMLFGAAPLGGIVNLVSKRPRVDAFLDAGLATGSYGLFETTIDANAPLTNSGSLLARLNLVYRTSDDFVQFSGKERIYVAPALTWNIGSNTRLTLLSRYEQDNDSPWSPVTAWGTVLPNANGELPIDFSVNDGSQRAVHNQEHKQIGYVFDHAFSDAFSFSQALRFTRREVFWNNWLFASGFVDGDIVDGVQQGRVIGRYLYGPFHQTDEDFAVDSRFNVKFATGAVRHNIAGGIDYRRNWNDAADEGGNFDPPANPLDIFDPDYSAPLVHDPIWAYALSGRSQQTGIYLQDHISLNERITLTVGGRQDWAKSDVEDQKFSPRIGMTYLVTPGVSLYASWSKSFTPQTGLFTLAGDQLPPETGRNVEGGVKIATPDGRLSGMISVFDLVRENVVTPDPADPFFYVVTGEQSSRGLEVEAIWTPTPNWTLSLAYAYLDAKVTKDNFFVVGTELPNVPKHSINLYSEYVFTEGPLANLGINLGVLYNSSKNGALNPEDLFGEGAVDPVSLFRLPSYVLIEAGASYRFGTWTARLNVNNIFDERYYPDSELLDRVTPGESRNWRLGLTKTF